MIKNTNINSNNNNNNFDPPVVLEQRYERRYHGPDPCEPRTHAHGRRPHGGGEELAGVGVGHVEGHRAAGLA